MTWASALLSLSLSAWRSRAHDKSSAGPEQTTLHGGRKLELKPNEDPKTSVHVEFGTIVKARGTARIRKLTVDDFVMITANLRAENTASVAMHFRYDIACFDKNGRLVGCASDASPSPKGLAAKASAQFGEALIRLPLARAMEALRYELAYYESPVEIGKD